MVLVFHALIICGGLALVLIPFAIWKDRKKEKVSCEPVSDFTSLPTDSKIYNERQLNCEALFKISYLVCCFSYFLFISNRDLTFFSAFLHFPPLYSPDLQESLSAF